MHSRMICQSCYVFNVHFTLTLLHRLLFLLYETTANLQENSLTESDFDAEN